MNPLMFWAMVFILKEHLDRLTLSNEMVAASVNRINGRLDEINDNLMKLRGVTKPLEVDDMDVD